jgi:branched-chain amino acid transport system substrate-binding protein
MKKISFVTLPKGVVLGLIVLAAMSLISFSAATAAEDTIQIAYSGPLSGPAAAIGEEHVTQLQHMIDKINGKGGVLGGKKFELVPLDNKFSVQESQVNIPKMISRNIRFMVAGPGSHISHGISDALRKHNSRNPGQSILFLNFVTQDIALTDAKCNFWHFRFYENTDMRMQALTNYVAKRPDVKKVFLINQDYDYGHAMHAAAKRFLKAKRPDIQLAGEVLHPTAKIKDFAPYIAKIKASGADSVITANWGTDLFLLIKAGEETGLDVNWLTTDAGIDEVVIILGKTGKGRVYQVSSWHLNVPNPEMEAFANSYEKKYDRTWYFLSIPIMFDMFAKALNEVGKSDPLRVAKALEGMHHQSLVGDVHMRRDDHQLIMPLTVSVYTDDVKYGLGGTKAGGTKMGFKTVMSFSAKDIELPTICKMERPD